MPREFVLRVVLADNFIDESDAAQDKEDLETGRFTFDDLLGVAENEPECSVTYEVRDI